MKKLFSFISIFCLVFLSAQNLKIVNKSNNNPMEGVILINQAGDLVGKTDINGEIDKSLLKNDAFYILNHPLIDTDTLYIKDIVDNQYKVTPLREMKIPEVQVKLNTKDYFVLEGYFNSFVTNNGVFSIFVDGILQFVFDRKTNKLKERNILQYRSFILESDDENRKNTSSIVFDNLVKLPSLKSIQYINDNDVYKKKYNETTNETKVDFSKSLLTEKEMSLFGYQFKDLYNTEIINFSGNKISPLRLIQYNKDTNLKMKHKSENEFSKIIVISNFYPNNIVYSNKNELQEGVKFNKNHSNYSTQFWQNESANSIYEFLKSKFPTRFKEMKNIQNN